jgi:hypothetical protein
MTLNLPSTQKDTYIQQPCISLSPISKKEANAKQINLNKNQNPTPTITSENKTRQAQRMTPIRNKSKLKRRSITTTS